MAGRLFKSNIDLDRNQLINAALENSTGPATPIGGQIYYDTADYRAKIYNGNTAEWDPLLTKNDFAAKGNLLVGTADGTFSALAVGGTNDWVLTVDSTTGTGMKWAAASAGFADPMTTRGDIITRGVATTGRLGMGSAVTQVIGTDGTDTVWRDVGVIVNASTAKTTLHVDDLIGIADSQALNVLKKIKYSELVTNMTTSLSITTVGDNLISLANPTAITFLRINADNTVSALSDSDFRTAIGAGTGSGTVTSVSGTANHITSTGGATPVLDLATAFGDYVNPYASKTANYILAAPNGTAGVPTFRSLVSADIPDLSGTYQPLGNELSALQALADTAGFLKKTGDATYSIDTATYATETYVTNAIAAVDGMIYKGTIACAANPNYPAANAGDTYKVSSSGKIGGASGYDVTVGDLMICNTDSSVGGTELAVGTEWDHIEIQVASELDGYVMGPGTHSADYVPQWNGANSDTLKAGKALSGLDDTIITGTKGTIDNLAMWNTDGDLVTASFTATSLTTLNTNAVLKTIVDAAGDLIIGTADDTVGKLIKGSNNTVLTVNGSGSVAWAELTTSNIATAAKTGVDTTLVTGTKATTAGYGAMWNTDGDLVSTEFYAAKKYTITPTATTADITITHGLTTRDVVVSVRQTNSPYRSIDVDWTADTTATVILHFASAPSASEFTVTVIG